MNIEKTVKNILSDVQKNGDKALIKYTAKFDRVRLSPRNLKVPNSELKNAWDSTPPHIKEALITAKNNIEMFHSAQMPEQWEIEPQYGVKLGQIFRPIEKVGIYVPGGRAPLVSTVLMTAIPAKIAGVKEIILTTPPPVDKYILSACYLAGVTSVYKIGGAQAIGAMAYGTKTIPKVLKIVGPGNVFVTTAKKLVFGDVDMDMPAGPSEILIIADNTANPKFIALDLLSQLEHDPMSKATLVATKTKGILDEINKELKNLERKNIISKKGLKIIKVPNLDKAVEICNNIAPEHLELMVENPEKLIPKIQNAGIILIGQYTPVALSDFLAGTNHVLPTGYAAKSFSGLNVRSFLKTIPIAKYSKNALYRGKQHIQTFAKIEGLSAHGKSVECR
jgi:histidinol dehydrogenase